MGAADLLHNSLLVHYLTISEADKVIPKEHCLSLSLSICSYHSVTRFGEILPLWQNVKSLCLFNENLFCIGQNFEPKLANFYEFGQTFILVNGPIFKREFSHLVTLATITIVVPCECSLQLASEVPKFRAGRRRLCKSTWSDHSLRANLKIFKEYLFTLPISLIIRCDFIKNEAYL